MLKINAYIEKKTKIVDERLKKLLAIDNNTPQKELLEAAHYALFPGGKKLRSILLLATVDTFNYNIEKALDVACAIELIHTYSLIHDDLPSMDNDDLRRNKPSLHKAFSESTALLTGDYLLTYAFEVIAGAADLSDAKKNKIVSIVAKSIGAEGMIGGQYIDLKSEGRQIDWETLRYMHLCKTAKLIVASLKCGGIIAGATEKEILALEKFGEHIGLAFQIVDDILDITSTEEILGKPVRSDEKQRKATAITVLGIKKSKEIASELYEKGILFLSTLAFPPPLLKDLAYKLVKREY